MSSQDSPFSYYYYLIPGLLVLASPLFLRLLSPASKPLRTTAKNTPPTMTTHTVVILGGGVVGVPLAHHLLKHTPPSVSLRVVLVSPNDALLWAFATVRAILPDTFGDDKIFFPIGPAFAKYGASRFEHVLGTAQTLNPDANTVEVLLSGAGGERRTLTYDTLVIATGSSFKESMPFKDLADTQSTKDAIHKLRKKIAAARSIVVAGAGETGVELAGELGQEFGLSGTKDITLIADNALPLGAHIRADVRKIAADELAKLRVKIVANTRVVDVSPSTGAKEGKQTLTLRASSKGATTTTLETDVYIPTFGVRPNTAFVPPALLDTTGRVRVDRTTLQVEGHANIFALGDVANAQSASGKHADEQVVYLAPALQDHLAGRSAPAFKPDDGVVLAVTIGRYRGTGQMGSWKLWGWLIRFAKGRHMGTDVAPEVIAGNRTMMQKKW